ncbi:hypothetical protein M3Y94_00915600 [Aphelenchoides besseyi]|nr:hypothetical protein M3Y94_00915600 [Aphelenchoides besseyi]KAI6223236.1 Viral ubiquitin [Aphelenchoides besseyi]
MKIPVIFVPGKEFTLNVKATDTVRKVKEMIQEQEGIPADQQIVTLLRKELKDDKMLMEYSIHKVKKPFLTCYMEKNRVLLEKRQANLLELQYGLEYDRILQQPPELREKLEERIAFLKDKLGITRKNSDSEQSTSHSGLRRRRVANE